MTIVLKDRADADVVFNHVSTNNLTLVYKAKGTNLMDEKVLTLQLAPNANTNRIRVKLSVPTLCAAEVGCKPTINYTQVASGDITVVKFSSDEDRADLSAMVGSLFSSTAVVDLVNDASFPV